MRAITKTDFKFKNQLSKYSGKVRDVYNINNETLVMVASDRISAFDVVMTKGIPYKGQILNQIACKMLKETSHIVPNWLISSPDPNVSIGRKLNLSRLKWLSEDICLVTQQDYTNLELEKFVESKCLKA